MRKSTLWTVLGVIAAVIIAWVVVNVVFSLIAFVFRLVAVA
ncbi:flagellar biosynthesis protein FlhA, partial [Microbacterium sp. SUBG005]